MRNRFFIVLPLLLTLSGITLAQTYGISYSDQPYKPQSGWDSISLCPPVPVAVELITDTISDPAVGHRASHQIGFRIPDLSYNPAGVLQGRQVVIAFPPEFTLGTIDSVSYRDTDDRSTDPVIAWVYVYSQAVVVRFGETVPGPGNLSFAYITLHHVTNAQVADDYRVTVQIENKISQLVAGPNFSESFGLLAGPPVALTVIPKEDLLLKAGEGVTFSAWSADQYGNPVAPGAASWSLDPSHEIIGRLSGGSLLATKVGVGRILARMGEMTAASGLLTVTPGPANSIILAHDSETVLPGQPLAHGVGVEIADIFGNRVVDYAGTIWFTSNDPLAVLTHGQSNPYQFTVSDQGRKLFPGNEFIFRTAGTRGLMVTDGTASGSTHDIVVLSGTLGSCEVILPTQIRAGTQFTISVRGARDGFGNPFTGEIIVTGGNAAPDGTAPILINLAVSNGDGSAPARLFAAGDNVLRLESGAFLQDFIVAVLPGDLAALRFGLDRTQFAGNHFRGVARLAAYDRYLNLKTDYDLSGSDVRLSADSGALMPDLVSAWEFVDGTADLSGVIYDGLPGPVWLKATTSDNGNIIEGWTEFVANGVRADIDGRTPIPTMIPEGWEFVISGVARNPGDIRPTAVVYRAGFPADGSLVPEFERPPQCVPLPGNGSVCPFSDITMADLAPGNYPFALQLDAVYVIGGDTITTAWKATSEITIVPFADFTVAATSLPDTGFAAEYSFPAELSIGNSNGMAQTSEISAGLIIAAGGQEYQLGGRSFSYGWPADTAVDFQAAFSPDISEGTYDYEVLLTVYLNGNDIPQVRMAKRYPLGRKVAIVRRARYAVDPATVTPKRVVGGATTPFALDLELIGNSSVILAGDSCLLILTDGAITSSARLLQANYHLAPGKQTVSTEPLLVPEAWRGKPITARLILVGVEAGILPVKTEISFDFPITLESAPAIQVVSLKNTAPNAPYVNVGQTFALTARIANRSVDPIRGPIAVRFSSDGQSLPPNGVTITVDSLKANDTISISQPVTASATATPAEIFSVTIDPISGVDILPALSDEAVAVIQELVNLALTPAMVSLPGTAAFIDYGEQFEVVATLGAAAARVSGGTLMLDYSGPGSFGLPFPSEKTCNTVVIWNLTAPALDIESSFSLAWKEAPIDRNTGEPVVDLGQPLLIPFVVRGAVSRLIIEAGGFTTRPLQRGVSSQLFDLSLQNVTTDSRNKMRVASIFLSLTDRDGRPIDPAGVVGDTGSNFYFDGKPAAEQRFVQGGLEYRFSGLVIIPGQTLAIEMRLMPRTDVSLDYFDLQLDGNKIAAEITEGPRIGQPVPVSGVLDRPFDINLPESIIPEELAASFKNYPNPFDPTADATEFKYFLPGNSTVDIRIYTATGEEVRHLQFAAGEPGGSAGVNAGVYWDGRNGDGDVVLNGVYIARIDVAEGGLKAMLKMAVVK